jgi:hypothetical protein
LTPYCQWVHKLVLNLLLLLLLLVRAQAPSQRCSTLVHSLSFTCSWATPAQRVRCCLQALQAAGPLLASCALLRCWSGGWAMLLLLRSCWHELWRVLLGTTAAGWR